MTKGRYRGKKGKGSSRPSTFFLVVLALGLLFLAMLFVGTCGRTRAPVTVPPASQGT
jgi:hypothetical protein